MLLNSLRLVSRELFRVITFLGNYRQCTSLVIWRHVLLLCVSVSNSKNFLSQFFCAWKCLKRNVLQKNCFELEYVQSQRGSHVSFFIYAKHFNYSSITQCARVHRLSPSSHSINSPHSTDLYRAFAPNRKLAALLSHFWGRTVRDRESFCFAMLPCGRCSNAAPRASLCHLSAFQSNQTCEPTWKYPHSNINCKIKLSTLNYKNLFASFVPHLN